MKIEAESKHYKWVMLGLLSVTYFLMQSTRQIFNASLPQIKLGLVGPDATSEVDAQLGLSRTIFLFSYGLMVPFAGIAADFLRRKWVIVLGAAFFGASVFFTGFADSLLMFFVFYGLLNGVGQCMIPGPASSLIAQYHHETRSTALSIYQSALYIGMLTASMLGGYLGGLSHDGWRWAFWGFGAVSLLWTVLLAALLRNTPPVHDSAAAADKPRFTEALGAFCSKPSAWLVMFAFGMLVFGSNCFRTWMPAYMQRNPDWNLTPASAGFHSVFWYYLGSFGGIAAGAWISDKLSRSRPGIRFLVMAVGMAVAAPAMVLMVELPMLWMSCAAMFVFGVANGCFDCNIYAGLFDVVAPRYRSVSMGIYICGAFLIGCPATAVLGWVGHHYSLGFGMAIFGSTYAIGAIALFLARFVFFSKDKVDGS